MNDLVISEREQDGTRYITLNTNKSTFRNIAWNDLGDWGRRKCENFLVLKNSNELRKKIQIVYAHATS